MKKKIVSILMCSTLIFGSLQMTWAEDTNQDAQITEVILDNSSYDFSVSDRDMDAAYDEADACRITFAEEKAAVDGSGAVWKDGKLLISEAGTYVISGSLSDGQIVVNTDENSKVQIVLAGVDISSQTVPLVIEQADKVFLTLAEGTQNQLNDGNNYEETVGETGVDGAVFSKCDLTINGTGNLEIHGNYKHGIVTKDDFVMTSGTVTIQAADTGLEGKDSVKLVGGSLEVVSGGDGIKAKNEEDSKKGFVFIDGAKINVTSGNDGIQAESLLYVADGEISINAGGGSVNAQAHTDDFQGAGMFGGGSREMAGKINNNGGVRPDSNWEGWDQETEASSEEKTEEITEAQTETADWTAALETAEALSVDEEEGTTQSDSAKGLKCASDLQIEGGSIQIDAADDGIHAGGMVLISDGTIEITSGDDGIHSDQTIQIKGGDLTISESYEGLEGNEIDIMDGNISVTASDDGLNASSGSTSDSGTEWMGQAPPDASMGEAPVDPMSDPETEASSESPQIQETEPEPFSEAEGTQTTESEETTSNSTDWKRGGGGRFDTDDSCILKINGGTLQVNAGGDGLDSNGALYITGGIVLVNGPENGGNGALDYGTEGLVSGGVVMMIGSSQMAEGFSDNSEQGTMITSIEEQEAGTTISLCDQDGTVLVSITSDERFDNVVASTPELKEGASYTLQTGEVSETNTVEDSVTVAEITMDSLHYGNSAGMMGGGTMSENGHWGHGPVMTES